MNRELRRMACMVAVVGFCGGVLTGNPTPVLMGCLALCVALAARAFR